jgi:hypothetical protein
VNSFKRIPGVAGLVLCKDTLNPVPGVSVTLANAMHIPVGSRVTDEDGFYMIAYKHKGKPSTYYVSIATPPPAVYTETKATTLKANAFVRLDFRAAACPNVAGESGTLALTTVTDRQALLSSPALLGNGTLECQVSGAAGQSYQIEASTNGTHWWPIYTNTDGGLFQFTDAKASNGSRRFYRAVLQQ